MTRVIAKPKGRMDLYGNVPLGRTDRFGVLELDGDRYLIPEDWSWAVRMAPGQARPKTIPSTLSPYAKAQAKRTMTAIRRKLNYDRRNRDDLGRFAPKDQA